MPSYLHVRPALLATATALLAVALLAGGCLRRPKTQPAAPVDPSARQVVPRPVLAAREDAVAIFDHAQAQQWDHARQRLAGLGAQLEQVIEAVGADAATLHLRELGVRLQRDLAGRDVARAMVDANQVAMETIRIESGFLPLVPPELEYLAYYARELEIWSGAGDLARMGVIAQKMQPVWQRIRPALEARGGKEHAECFQELMDRLIGAQDARTYGELARQARIEVGAMQGRFLP
jgi:hypothetical protein